TISEEDFCQSISSRRARIKALFMDQHVFAGIGNIYADESLWKACIHPARLGASLDRKQIRNLFRALQKTLQDAIRWRGSSISDYLDVEGFPGEYQQRHRVYQRAGKKCFRCRGIIRNSIVAGRTTHFCPRCQPAPRASRRRRAGS
ncbi:MAG: bifunctional DNA-formamidopyrimidine glycosylase/DNA-(apurinic or apyrimidinic site) lyase, partial [Acidobacteria bacterium]|nr:bifunctional DNA-formamidopyrimidine glycosylase/DNA-(apurinic or apyrimidinic site) lyase [Acidobacteriota bacterium]